MPRAPFDGNRSDGGNRNGGPGDRNGRGRPPGPNASLPVAPALRLRNFRNLINLAGSAANLGVVLHLPTQRIEALAAGYDFSDEAAMNIEDELSLIGGFMDRVNPAISAELESKLRLGHPVERPPEIEAYRPPKPKVAAPAVAHVLTPSQPPSAEPQMSTDSPVAEKVATSDHPTAAAKTPSVSTRPTLHTLQKKAAATAAAAAAAAAAQAAPTASSPAPAPTSTSAPAPASPPAVAKSTGKAGKAASKAKKTLSPRPDGTVPRHVEDPLSDTRAANLILLTDGSTRKGYKRVVAELMGWSHANLSHRLSGHTKFTRAVGNQITEVLGLEPGYLDIARKSRDEFPKAVLDMLEERAQANLAAGTPMAQKKAAPKASPVAAPADLKLPRLSRGVAPAAATAAKTVTPVGTVRRVPAPGASSAPAATPAPTPAAPPAAAADLEILDAERPAAPKGFTPTFKDRNNKLEVPGSPGRSPRPTIIVPAPGTATATAAAPVAPADVPLPTMVPAAAAPARAMQPGFYEEEAAEAGPIAIALARVILRQSRNGNLNEETALVMLQEAMQAKAITA